ncbi:protein of unknown function (DUF4803) [Popillia japonica]|uniref:Uncharacterized protein n=1 Tax=Popillia japonica TaxID=7064 RepID=A0AAW1MFQ4_POPJA
MFKNVRTNIGVELQQLEGSTLYDNITSVIKDSEDQLLFSDLFKSMIQIDRNFLYDNITSVIKDSEDQLLFSDLFKSMIQIDRNFDQLQEYSKEESNVNATTIVQFATETVSHRSTSVKMLMDKIHQYITPKVKYIYHGGLLQIIANNTIPQQTLATLFDNIFLTEMKGYAVVIFSYDILEIYDEGYYTKERKLAAKIFRKNLEKVIRMSVKLFDYRLNQYEKGRLPIAVFAQNIIKSGWKTLEDHSDLRLNRTTKQKQARTSRKISNTADLFWQLEGYVSLISFDVYAKIVQSNANYSIDKSRFLDFYSFMADIDKNFELLVEYTENEDFTGLINLADEAISSKTTSVKLLMETIHDHINPNITHESGDGLLKLLADNIKLSDEMIDITGQSPNQLLYNFFNKIALTQMKGYAVIQFSYAILEIYDRGYYETESILANEKIRKILKELSQETIRTTAKLSRHYWKPDPEEYKRGEHYLEISRLLQGYIVNEKVLSNDGKCYAKCEQFKEVNIIKCQNDPFCRKQPRCSGRVYNCRYIPVEDMQIGNAMPNVNNSKNGRVYNCRYIPVDPFCRKQPRCSGRVYNCRYIPVEDMQICLAPAGTTRRYNYIEYKNRNPLGVKSTCPTPLINVHSSIGWCPYCMCFCDEEGPYSDRYFSLKHRQKAVSDVKNNKVVTGIRFAKKNRMIHLQVQQGEILPQGVINVTSLEWVPVNKFKISDRFIHDQQDYLRITSRDKAVDLHVIEVDSRKKYQQQVLTGVRFAAVQSGINRNDKRIHLNLEIKMTKYNFKSGELFINRGADTWYRNIDTEFSPNVRTRIPTNDLDVPTRAKSKNTIVSNGDQYVEFTHTDITKDVAQTTVPFIDTQDVVPKVPTPLAGAGLYYKSSPGYGGFIGLKIVTYDFTPHL